MNLTLPENEDTCSDMEMDVDDRSEGSTQLTLSDIRIDQLPMPVFEKGRFQNPWKINRNSRFSHLCRILNCTKDGRKIPHKNELEKTLPVVKSNLQEFQTSPTSGVRHMWLGHSTSLIQFDGVTILTDPMFSNKFSSVNFCSIKRFRPVPCTIEELPPINCVLISHSHFDHLDQNSVEALNDRFGDNLCWYVPMGLKKWMNHCGCARVVEMTWWQEDMVNDELNVKIVCTPCQHWSKRTAHDENKVLWCTWSIIGPWHSFFFCGDTAYCDVFKLIGKRLGPFTLAALPIGEYSPRKMLSSMHIDPAQAVSIHEDLKAETSIGIHWGTFPMSSEPYLEPRKMLKAEIQQRNMKVSSFITVKHGEISVIGSDHLQDLD
uniref:N-acetylphosphatidylethanolamine-hydrolyzing phospholipase D n=1 Tax=Biomphalaria glabrata TaxID=6526 RepID=A0A2C9KFL2_BIOGL